MVRRFQQEEIKDFTLAQRLTLLKKDLNWNTAEPQSRFYRKTFFRNKSAV